MLNPDASFHDSDLHKTRIIFDLLVDGCFLLLVPSLSVLSHFCESYHNSVLKLASLKLFSFKFESGCTNIEICLF